MNQVLSGLRVLDFGHYIAGPYAAMLLAEQGADVIKIEPPGGDPFRGQNGFIVWNRSKKGMRLDLKKPEGREIAHKLAAKSDVIIENFSPGVADRLGIGYETVQKLNPAVVYCSISGFGSEGHYRDKPGWDPIVASVTSLYAVQGGLVSPLYLVLPLPSYYAALAASFSVATALFARHVTGLGQKVDVSLFSAILGAYSSGLVDYEGRVKVPLPIRNQQGDSPVYRLYQGSDGRWFFLALGNLTFITKFAVAMGHDEWLTDPRFTGAPFVIPPPYNTELATEFQKIFATRTRDQWLEFLMAADIPCAPTSAVEEFMNDPQVLANDMVVALEQPGLGTVREMGVPLKLELTPGRIKGPAPLLGQHTTEVLTSLGYSAHQIVELKNKGVI